MLRLLLDCLSVDAIILISTGLHCETIVLENITIKLFLRVIPNRLKIYLHLKEIYTSLSLIMYIGFQNME